MEGLKGIKWMRTTNTETFDGLLRYLVELKFNTVHAIIV
jgi:hypothetical protein